MRITGIIVAVALVGGTLSACTPVPLDPERVAQQCEERARAAMGPTGSVRIGTNSNTGPYAGAQIGISGDYIAGRDPYEVYNQCYYQRMGEAPIRPPRL